MFKDLERIDWPSVARTFGNCHSTLIGTFVNWWNAGTKHCALEAACKPRTGTPRRLLCDAIFCEADNPTNPRPVGLLEVEASPTKSMERFGHYLNAHDVSFTGIKFVMLAVYDCVAEGGKTNRRTKHAFAERDIRELGRRFLEEHPAQRFYAIIVRKKHANEISQEPLPSDSIRARNGYYPCTIAEVTGFEVVDDGEGPTFTFYPRPDRVAQ